MADGKIVIDVNLNDKNMNKQLQGIDSNARKGAGGIKKLAGALGLVAVAAGSIKLIKDSLGKAFKRIDTFEQFDRVMTAVTGSADEANRALETTDEIVTGTAYTLDGAAQSVQNFVTRGLSIDQATKYMEAFGDAVAFYGDGSQEQFDNVQDALAKMVTKGTVEMDQLNRLFDAGIDAVGMYAQATDQNAGDVQKALSSGEISAEDFIDTVSTAMEEGTNGVVKIAGAAKENGSTWGSTFSNMKTAVARGVANIITSIDEMLESNGLPNMREMVTKFGDKFEEVLTKAGEAIPSILEKIIAVYEALKPWLPLIAGVVAAVASFMTVIKVVNMVRTAFMAARTAVMIFNATLLANPIALIIAVIVGLAVLIFMYWDQIKAVTIAVFTAIKDFFVMIWEAIKAYFIAAFEIYKQIFTTAWNVIKTVTMTIFNAIKTALLAIWNAIKTSISTVINAIKKVITTVWNAIKTASKAVWNGIKSVISGVINGIKSVITTVFNAIKSVVSKVWNGIKSVSSSVWNGIKSTVSGVVGGIKSFIAGAFNTIKSKVTGAWDGIKSSTSNVWDGIKGTIKGAVNGIIGAINGMIGGLNKLKIKLPKVPDWVPGLGGKGGQTIGFNIPKIPKLDVGTNMVKRDGLAMIHEGEAVVPKKYNPAAGNGGGVYEFNIEIPLDGETIAKKTVRFTSQELEKLNKSTARRLGVVY